MSAQKPPLGPVPWLPPRGWSTRDGPVPAGGPHLFVLPTATLEELCDFWRTYALERDAQHWQLTQAGL